jgi:hypothetical protein
VRLAFPPPRADRFVIAAITLITALIATVVLVVTTPHPSDRALAVFGACVLLELTGAVFALLGWQDRNSAIQELRTEALFEIARARGNLVTDAELRTLERSLETYREALWAAGAHDDADRILRDYLGLQNEFLASRSPTGEQLRGSGLPTGEQRRVT